MTEQLEGGKDDSDRGGLPAVTDHDIIGAIKMLEGTEGVEDFATYKINTRKLFEQLLLKLEENSDHIYSLEHRVKFLEQECEDKDMDIERLTLSMQDAVNECRQDAEEMVNELMGKVSMEVNQRHEVEGLLRRLQSENAKLKDYAAMQKVPGWNKSLDKIIEEATRKETRVYEKEFENLRACCEEAEQKLAAFQLQREAEMNATMAVIKFAHEKIETLHLRLKIQQQKEQHEIQQKNNKKKRGKKSKNNFNTPQQVDSPDGSITTSTPVSTPTSSPPSSNSSKPVSSNDKALHKRNSRGRKGSKNNTTKNPTQNTPEKNVEGSDDNSSVKLSFVPSTPTSPAESLDSNDNVESEGKVTPEVLVQKSRSFWGRFQF